MSNKENIQKLFDSFGKPSSGGQFNTYLEWADKQDCDEVANIVEIAIQSFEKFPSLAQLYATAKKHKKHDFQHEEECYYCASTGFVPALFKPIKNKILLPYIREFACKCSRGLVMNHPRRYFDTFQDLQFQDKIEKHSDLSYPQIVYWIRRRMINEIQNSNLKPAMHDA